MIRHGSLDIGGCDRKIVPEIRAAFEAALEGKITPASECCPEKSRLKAEIYREYGSLIGCCWQEILETLPREWDGVQILSILHYPRESSRVLETMTMAAGWCIEEIGKNALKVVQRYPEALKRIDDLKEAGAGEIKWLNAAQTIVSGIQNAAFETTNTFLTPVLLLTSKLGCLPKDLREPGALQTLLAPLEAVPPYLATLHFEHFREFSDGQSTRMGPVEICQNDQGWGLRSDDLAIRFLLSSAPVTSTPRRVCPAHQAAGAFEQITRWTIETVIDPSLTFIASART